MAADPVDPIETDEDDVALLQLTSGSTGSPKAVQITHRNLVSNAEAMFVGAEFDMDSDVIVSWLPLFHDMGMTGFLTVPMYFGAELVKITPMDFLQDILLWARLIDKYKGTMTAAPNFAYALLAKRLRRQAQPGEFDLSSLRWALSGAEQVEPADVEDLIEAGRPFGLRPEAILPAYGMAESTVAVSFSKCGGGLQVDEVDVDLLATLQLAVPSHNGNTVRLATLGPLLAGLQARVVDEFGALVGPRSVGVIEVRGEPVTRGYITKSGIIPTQDDGRLVRHRRSGIPHRGRSRSGLRPREGRHHHGRPQRLPHRHRAGGGSRRRSATRLRGGRAAGRGTVTRIVRGRSGVQRLPGFRRGDANQAPGRP